VWQTPPDDDFLANRRRSLKELLFIEFSSKIFSLLSHSEEMYESSPSAGGEDFLGVFRFLGSFFVFDGIFFSYCDAIETVSPEFDPSRGGFARCVFASSFPLERSPFFFCPDAEETDLRGGRVCFFFRVLPQEKVAIFPNQKPLPSLKEPSFWIFSFFWPPFSRL